MTEFTPAQITDRMIAGLTPEQAADPAIATPEAKPPVTDPKPVRPTNLVDVGGIAMSATSTIVEKAMKLVTKTEAKLAEIEHMATRAHESLMSQSAASYSHKANNGGTIINTKAKEAAERIAGAAADQLRKQKSDEALQALNTEIATLKTYQDQLAGVRDLFPSEIVMLGRYGIGTPERSQYQMQVQHAGQAELTNLAKYAVATKNLHLGAAVLAQMGAVNISNPDKRTEWAMFKKSMATALVGDQFNLITASIAKADSALVDLTNIRRRLVGGESKQTLALNSIKRGLDPNAPDYREKKSVEPEQSQSSLDKIKAGLKARQTA